MALDRTKLHGGSGRMDQVPCFSNSPPHLWSVPLPAPPSFLMVSSDSPEISLLSPDTCLT